MRFVKKQKNPNVLWLIFIVMLMDVMGITILSPVAPQIVLKYSDQALMVSMITVIYAAGQFIAAPLLGKLGDRFGRRPILLISIFGQGIGYLVFAFGGSLAVLFLGRAIGGITAGNMSTAGAFITDTSKPEERARGFTVIGNAWSLGLIFGPLLGGVFGQINLIAPAYVAAAFSFLNVLLAFFFLPESLPVEKRQTTPLILRDYNPFASIGDMARKPGLGMLLLISAIFGFAFDGVNSTSALYLIEKYTAQTWQVSLALTILGVANAVMNTFFVVPMIRKYGEKGAGIASLVCLCVAFAGTFFSPVLWLIYPLNAFWGAGNAVIFPVLNTLSVNRVELHEAGVLMGVITAVGSAMNIIGPLWGGLVYDHVMLGSPYWMGAIGMLVSAWLLSRIPKPALVPSVN
jgi:DHA1 family tetracycline resistance protein-like MFS transporter